MFIITGQLKPKQNLHHIWGGHDVLSSPRLTFWGTCPPCLPRDLRPC